LCFAHVGGGIVFDSDPYDEWLETMNKLGSNTHTIASAEKVYARLQSKSETGVPGKADEPEVFDGGSSGKKAHIDFAAG
jgi:anthranilate synthase component I